MIKMMVTVVIVFTVCWLPLNVLLVMTDGDLVDWDCLPYLWWAFHWLAMSHSCYNPIIYCWMNAKFRVGFCCALSRVPCLRWLARRLTPGPNTSCSSAFGGATITHVGGGRSIGPRGRPSTSMGPSTTSSFLVFKGGNNGKCAGSSRPGSVLLGPSIHQYGGGGGRGQNRRSSRNRDSDIDMEVDEASLLHRVDTGTSYVSVRRANSSGKTNGESVNLTDNGNNGDFGSGNLHHGRGRYHHHHHRTHQTEMEDKI